MTGSLYLVGAAVAFLYLSSVGPIVVLFGGGAFVLARELYRVRRRLGELRDEEVRMAHLLRGRPEPTRVVGIARTLPGHSLAGLPGWLYVRSIYPGTAGVLGGEPDMVVDRAVDFLVVDAHGRGVWVEVQAARLESSQTASRAPVAFGIRDGDPVEVIGEIGERVDPTVVERSSRETPMRRVLRGDPLLPVRIVAAGGPSRLDAVPDLASSAVAPRRG